MTVKIAVDVMGGDYAPEEIIDGAILSTKKQEINVVLVGLKDKIESIIKKYKYDTNKVKILAADDVVTMTDIPSEVIKHKKNSSIAIAIKEIANKNCDAVISAGNSGVVMAYSMMFLKKLPWIIRPAIAAVLPTINGFCLLLDVGANVDCKPKYLLQFAIMGSIYMKELFNKHSPRVGLLSIGEEETKGNLLSLEAYEILKKTNNINFVGNIEGRDIPLGKVDIAVCDGFTGNILLKFGEGVAEMLFKLIKLELKKHPITFISIPIIWLTLKNLIKKVDSTEYGGAPLLGVDGVCIICHGSSNSKAIANAIHFAAEYSKKNINQKIAEEISKCME